MLVKVKMAFVRVRNTCIVHHKMPQRLGGVFFLNLQKDAIGAKSENSMREL